MKKFFVWLALALALTSTGVLAQSDTREARLKVAREYLAATLADMDMEATIQQMWKPVVDQIRKQGVNPTDQQIRELDTLYQQTFAGPLREIMLAQDQVMADIMTLNEITALRDFYASEVGRSVMRKLPEMLGRQQPMILQMVQSKMPLIMPKIQEIISQGQ